MGAHDISFTLDGNKSREDVLKEFRHQQDEGREENGHAQGYSGDFQTVHKVEFHDKTFATAHEAMEYCLNNAEKFTNVIAVKYKIKAPIKKNAKYTRLIEKEIKLKKFLSIERDQAYKGVLNEFKAKPFVTCKNCKSRMNTKHLEVSWCRICTADLTPIFFIKRIARAQTKVDKASAELSAYREALQAKAGYNGEKWLVAGWGAC